LKAAATAGVVPADAGTHSVGVAVGVGDQAQRSRTALS